MVNPRFFRIVFSERWIFALQLLWSFKKCKRFRRALVYIAEYKPCEYTTKKEST